MPLIYIEGVEKMKKIVICNIPMKENVDKSVYTSNDLSLPASSRAVRFPINAFLEETMKQDDELKFVLLTKNDEYSYARKNAEDFISEIDEINKNIGAKLEFVTIDTVFSQELSIHGELMAKIVDQIDVDSHILADITYGSKDMPIVLFSAMEFAERFLRCEIDNIIYGQANFEKGNAVNTKICDMISLYGLNIVTGAIHCDEPEKARQMLKALLSF